MLETYKPSGSVSPMVFLTFLVGIVATVLLAIVYQFLLWIPFIIAGILFALFFGYSLWFLSGKIITWGHTRNPIVAGIFGFLIGTIGIGAKFWTQYEVDFYSQVNLAIQEVPELAEKDAQQNFRELLREKYTIFEHLELRVQNGWNVGRGGANGIPIAGFFVYLIWAIEAIIVLGLSAGGAAFAASHPYSEKLEKWASKKEPLLSLPVTDEGMIKKVKEVTSIEELLDIPIPKSCDTPEFLSYVLHCVPDHEKEDSYLSVLHEVVTVDNDGNESRTEEGLIEFAILNDQQRILLAEKAELYVEAIDNYLEAQAQKENSDV